MKSCTHLIAAFLNTPKCNEVKDSGHGAIVGAEWIEDCHTEKKRLPEDDYLLEDPKGGNV
jgi:hypothetical protein